MNGLVLNEFPVGLVGGSEIKPSILSKIAQHCNKFVAADGGADSLMGWDFNTALVIGDMDSISDTARAEFADVLLEVAEQETTDFDKALRHIASPLVLAAGVSGGRLDHELAALNCLARHPSRPCLIVGPETITCLLPPRFEIDLPAGSDLSLFPLGEVEVVSQGLKWPTEGLMFSPLERVGTSNRVTGPVRLSTSAPAMLLILPFTALDAAVAALLAAPRWP